MRTCLHEITVLIKESFQTIEPGFLSGSYCDIRPDQFPLLYSFNESPRRKGEPLLDFIDTFSLMSKRLVKTLEDAGVDNLQKFPTRLINKDRDEIIDDFYTVNIVGLVAAADHSRSKSLQLGGGHVFTDLKIDLEKTRGLSLFRLADSLLDVVIHELVVKAIVEADFRGLLLTSVAHE